jgi:acetoin utilization deacetylase AcuC-like enzyme
VSTGYLWHEVFGAIAMTEAVVRGEIDNCYALVNPAGHHALPETGLGFCIVNSWI